MNIVQIIKLSKMIQKFAEVETNNGILICNGDLAEGVEVFVEVDGEVAPAPDGEYEAEDKVIVVAEGKVAEIKDKEEANPEPAAEPANEAPVEAPVEENQEEVPAEPANEPANEPDERDQRIAELEARIAELEAENQALKEQVNKAEEELSKPVVETKMEKEKPLFKTYFRK